MLSMPPSITSFTLFRRQDCFMIIPMPHLFQHPSPKPLTFLPSAYQSHLGVLFNNAIPSPVQQALLTLVTRCSIIMTVQTWCVGIQKFH